MMLRHGFRFVFTCAMALALQACGPRHANWTEEVRLSPTEVVTIERSVRFNMAGQPGEVPVPVPVSQTIVVKTGSAATGPWASPLEPIFLGRNPANNDLVLIATMRFCGQWEAMGRPNPPYWSYEWTGENWASVSVPASLIGRETNLLDDWKADENGVITEADKSARRRRYETSDYNKTIVSETRDFKCASASHREPANR